VKITVEKGGVALVCSLARQSTMRHAAKCTPELWREGSSNKDQVKKQAALDGAHEESFDRLREVINKTADVTNRKVVKLFPNSNQRAKNSRRS